jgi:MFS transporter, DHA1 family, multidrug resistance protein
MLRPDTLVFTVMLAMLTSLGPLSTDLYLPSLPSIARDLSATTSGTQLTLSLYLLGFAAGQLFYGPISDKVGRKPAILWGLALYCAGTLACVFAPNIQLLIVARFVQALGAAGPIVLARAIVRDLFEGPRAGREMARMASFMGVVPMIAPVLGGVIETTVGWRASFGAIMVAGGLLVLMVLLLLPETLREKQDQPISARSILQSFGIVLRNPGYRVDVGMNALAYAGIFSYISASSFILQGVFGLSPLLYGFAFAFPVFGFISGTLLAQGLMRRLGMRQTVGVGVGLMIVAAAIMMVSIGTGFGGALGLVLPFVVYFIGIGLVMPLTAASALSPFAERAGAASSLMGLVQMGFAALAGGLLGMTLGTSALPLPIAICCISVALAALYWFGKRRMPA